MTKPNSSHICPVCGEHEFREVDSYEICPICGWEDDWYQESSPDDDVGANEMCLNEYREAYKNGWRPDWLVDGED